MRLVRPQQIVLYVFAPAVVQLPNMSIINFSHYSTYARESQRAMSHGLMQQMDKWMSDAILQSAQRLFKKTTGKGQSRFLEENIQAAGYSGILAT